MRNDKLCPIQKQHETLISGIYEVTGDYLKAMTFICKAVCIAKCTSYKEKP